MKRRRGPKDGSQAVRKGHQHPQTKRSTRERVRPCRSVTGAGLADFLTVSDSQQNSARRKSKPSWLPFSRASARG